MTIYYSFNNEEEEKELKNILLTEAKLHFGNNKFTLSLYRKIWYKIKTPNSLFIRDLNKSKDKFYSGESCFVLTDFMSCVEENLSFVPKVEIDDE